MSQRRLLLVGFVMLLLTSLACSLGGDVSTPAPQPSAVVVVVTQLVPVQGTPVSVSQPTQQPIAGQPTITQAPQPTAQPTTTPIVGSGPGGCVLNAAFVADVTIPDNTVFAPNASFVKTWRLKNTGTCTWDAGYQFIFAEGNQMSGPAGVPINVTAPGANLDVSVNLKAPAAPSATPYVGKWTLKASNSVIFGGKYTVVIVVPLPPTATPTVTPTTAPTGAWSGHWETNCGSYNCGVMELVQTGNTVVGTYYGDGTTGTVNGTVNGNHLSGTWSHLGGTGKLDWWMGSGLVKWRGNWDGVNGWCGHRTGETDPAPCGVGTFNGNWIDSCASGCSGTVHIEQDGRNFTGTYFDGSRTVDGTIDGNTLTGQWHIGALSGNMKWFLLNYNQFNGNYDTTFGWCAYRAGSGSSLPATCKAP
jgi:hypothetical protein